METVYRRSVESYDKALEFLLMQGEVSGLDGQHAVAAEAKHVLEMSESSEHDVIWGYLDYIAGLNS